MPTDQWRSFFMNAADGTVSLAWVFEPLRIDGESAVGRWTPTAEQFSHVPDTGPFVFGPAIGAVLHTGIMQAAATVIEDGEFPMTVQEEHRFYRPIVFGTPHLLTSRASRRTRSTLWTASMITAEESGEVMAESSAVSQVVRASA
jgi:acyl-coenzyme A thioesterase PaaI-like protein